MTESEITQALERADRLINAMIPYIKDMALQAQDFDDLNKHWLFMERKKKGGFIGSIPGPIITSSAEGTFVINEETERFMVPLLVDAIYPILLPVEQQDCTIQAKNHSLMVKLATELWRSFIQNFP